MTSQKKKSLKRIKKNQVNTDEPCKSELNSQTRNPINS